MQHALTGTSRLLCNKVKSLAINVANVEAHVSCAPQVKSCLSLLQRTAATLQRLREWAPVKCYCS